MAKKKQESSDVQGRALVDIPEVGAKCGDYISLPEAQAEALAVAGSFDPQAVLAE